jgi:hypothetical protein
MAMSFIICNPQIKENVKGGAYGTYGEVINVYRGFVGKHFRKETNYKIQAYKENKFPLDLK